MATAPLTESITLTVAHVTRDREARVLMQPNARTSEPQAAQPRTASPSSGTSTGTNPCRRQTTEATSGNQCIPTSQSCNTRRSSRGRGGARDHTCTLRTRRRSSTKVVVSTNTVLPARRRRTYKGSTGIVKGVQWARTKAHGHTRAVRRSNHHDNVVTLLFHPNGELAELWFVSEHLPGQAKGV